MMPRRIMRRVAPRRRIIPIRPYPHPRADDRWMVGAAIVIAWMCVAFLAFPTQVTAAAIVICNIAIMIRLTIAYAALHLARAAIVLGWMRLERLQCVLAGLGIFELIICIITGIIALEYSVFSASGRASMDEKYDAFIGLLVMCVCVDQSVFAYAYVH